jgi:uncharacterized protein YuzE
MIFRYYPDTDMLYIELANQVSTESEEVAPGIVLDFDEKNHVIGIEIEDASTFVDLSRLEVSALPIAHLIFSATPSGPGQPIRERDIHAEHCSGADAQ